MGAVKIARARNIKPGFFLNDELADIQPLGRLLFIGLWTIADREGRLEDRPKKIKAACLPYDDCDVESLLDELFTAGFIIRYGAGASTGQEGCKKGANYIQVSNFTKHQQPHAKEKLSEIPACDTYFKSPGQAPDKKGASTGQKPLIPDSLNLIPEEESAGATPPKSNINPWNELTDNLIEEWAKLYPHRPDPDYIKDFRKKVFQSVSSGQPRAAITTALKRIYEGEHILGFGRFVTEATQGRNGNENASEERAKAHACLKDCADLPCRAVIKKKQINSFCTYCERGKVLEVSKG